MSPSRKAELAGTLAPGAMPAGRWKSLAAVAPGLALLIASLLVGLVITLLTVHLEGQWRPTGVPVHFRR